MVRGEGGHGEHGLIFENNVAKKLESLGMSYKREFAIQGKGKLWHVDFYLPELEAIVFCKNMNPKSRASRARFLADFARILDLLNTSPFNVIMLYKDFFTSLNNVKMCTSYKVYLLFRLNGLDYILDRDFGTMGHVKKINDVYVKLKSIAHGGLHLRKNEFYGLLKKRPYTIRQLERKTGYSFHEIVLACNSLCEDNLVISRRKNTSQGGPMLYWVKSVDLDET